MNQFLISKIILNLEARKFQVFFHFFQRKYFFLFISEIIISFFINSVKKIFKKMGVSEANDQRKREKEKKKQKENKERKKYI